LGIEKKNKKVTHFAVHWVPRALISRDIVAGTWSWPLNTT